jgi:hypothetical protein
MAGHEGAAHGDVLLGADLGVVIGPALAGIVEEADPEQIIFGPIVDQQVGVAVAFGVTTGIGGSSCRVDMDRLSNRDGEAPV